MPVLRGVRLAIEAGELGQVQLLGARVGPKAAGAQSFFGAFAAERGTQVVEQGLAFLAEAGLYKLQKLGFVSNAQSRPGAGQRHGHEGGSHLGSRTKRAGRNTQDDFRAGIKLSEDGKVGVLPTAGAGGQAGGHFELDDDVDGLDAAGVLEQPVEDGRGNVVGKIAVHAEAVVPEEAWEVQGEHISGNDFDVRPKPREVAETRHKPRVQLDGHHATRTGGEQRGHLTVPRADFQPRFIGSACGRIRSQTDGPCDARAPARIQEMLSQALASHGEVV